MSDSDRTIPRDDDDRRDDAELDTGRTSTDETANPPRTTTGKITSPKFGSAGSGGLELEPGPERD